MVLEDCVNYNTCYFELGGLFDIHLQVYMLQNNIFMGTKNMLNPKMTQICFIKCREPVISPKLLVLIFCLYNSQPFSLFNKNAIYAYQKSAIKLVIMCLYVNTYVV
ncbi:uncharacterized protein DS421_3g85700 [Arachis hypogaea]|nr:uncharacterized protein DS421_3g85700 [Arachis hypogaea]